MAKKNSIETEVSQLDEFDAAPEIGGGEVWKPVEIGDKLIGEIINLDQNRNNFGVSVQIKRDDGSTTWTPAHAWLQNRLAKLDGEGMFAAWIVKAGQKIGIRYDGKGEKKGRNPAPSKYTVKDLSSKSE
jgi:hypothetical protein